MIHHTRTRLESFSLNYNHKKTVFVLVPSILRTAEYLQSMIIRLPSKPTSSKPKSPKQPILPLLSSLCRECLLKFDLRIEEISFGFLASWSHPTPLVDAVFQSITCSFLPSSTRASLETITFSSNDLQFKIGSFDIKNVPISKETLRAILHDGGQNVTVPQCSERIFSLDSLEVTSTISNWERLSVECGSKMCNISLSYSVLDMMVCLMEVYVEEVAEYLQHKHEVPKTSSFLSFETSSPSMASPQTPMRPMSEADEDALLLENILNGTLLPDGLNEVVDISQMDIPGSPFTPQEVSSSPSLTSSIGAPADALPHESIDDSDTEILLSDGENQIDKTVVDQKYRLLPFFVTDFLIQLNSVEVQIIGIDASRSTSYTVKCISLAVVSKSFESLDKVLDISSADYGVELPQALPVYHPVSPFVSSEVVDSPSPDGNPHSQSNLPSETTKPNDMSSDSNSGANSDPNDPYTPPQPISALHTINESSKSLMSNSGFDLNLIPDSPLDSAGSLYIQPLTIRKKVTRRSPLLSMSNYAIHTPSVSYLRNSGVEYTIKIELLNLTIIGDEGSHDTSNLLGNKRPNESGLLPLMIPKIQISLPTLLFVAFPFSQLPRQSDFAFSLKQYHYQSSSLFGFSGFLRGDQGVLFLATTNQELNEIHCQIDNPQLKLSFGSIFVIYHSFVELASTIKNSTIQSTIASLKRSSVAKARSKSPSPFLDWRLRLSLSRLYAVFDFTSEVGLQVQIEKITAVTPDSLASPLFLLMNLQISQLHNAAVVGFMVTVAKITLYSPFVYDKFYVQLHPDRPYDENSSPISVHLCSCKKCVACHRYVTCPTCIEHGSDQNCNGWDNRCNQHCTHVPAGVKPYLILIESVDCTQDRRFPWGDLIYQAQLQWKAFKTIRRGQKPPPPFPHPDAERVAKVADHTPFPENAFQNGIWLQLIADSVILHFQDIIPVYSPESAEYSQLFVNDINGVLMYHPQLHSRAHFLQFIQAMDDAPTPLQQGFDDVLGLHVHDLNVAKVVVDFGELPPLVAGENLSACGTFVLADMNRVESYVRRENIQLYCSSTYDPIPVEILRCSVSAKLYQNFVIEGSQLEVFWGSSLFWVRTSFSNGMGSLTPRGVSKSPKMPWYDKLRFSLHGPLFLRVHDQLRINWMTEKIENNKYEAIIIDFVNADTVFRQSGGCAIAFDSFSIGTATFDNQQQLVETSLITVEDGEWDVSLLWGNEDTRNHYVELDPGVSDDVDKYARYRSNTIEWKIRLLPLPNRDYDVSIYLRLEMVDFLWEFWNMTITPNPAFPLDHTPGLFRNSTAFDIDLVLNDSMVWL